MSTEVMGVVAHPTNERRRYVNLLVDGNPQKAICFSTKADELKLGPLPEGWYTKMGDYGLIVEPPREARAQGQFGGQAAFRNTEAGARLEQRMMNRRTALMTARDLIKEPGTDFFKFADDCDEWLERVGR